MSFLIASHGHNAEVYIMNDNVRNYILTITMANKLLDNSIITRKEFLVFEEKMRLKYNIPKCSLYRDFHLLYSLDQR